jgi:hypothetical protein
LFEKVVTFSTAMNNNTHVARGFSIRSGGIGSPS